MIRHTVAFRLKHPLGSPEEAAFLETALVLKAIPSVRKFEQLPMSAQSYLKRVEALTGVPIALISTGFERDDTILMQHPLN